MMQIIPQNFSANFLEQRKWGFWISGVLFAATILLLVFKGLNFGIDFVGGTQIQIQTEQVVEIGTVRQQLAQANLGLDVQQFGTNRDFVLRAPVVDNEQADALADALTTALQPVAGAVDVRSVEFVGPQVGAELREKGVIAVVVSLLAILAYISMRFEFRYGVGAIVALFHDVFLTVGIYSLMQREVSLPVLAALLTVIGYSLNDTIVVFDRVRENTRKYRKKPIVDMLNQSLNEMLNRTLMTSLTTLVVLVALFVVGGEAIHEFSFTLMFGVIVGTYSSIFVASPIVMYMDKWAAKRKQKQGENPEEPNVNA